MGNFGKLAYMSGDLKCTIPAIETEVLNTSDN